METLRRIAGFRSPPVLERFGFAMPTENEIARLAAAANAIRPEWPIRSLLTLLTKHQARPLRDLAVALVWIACDPTTRTPARLAEPGPWWTATSMSEGVGPAQTKTFCPDHPGMAAGHCPGCIACAVPRPDYVVVPKRDKHEKTWDEATQTWT